MNCAVVERKYLTDCQMNIPQQAELLDREEVRAILRPVPKEYQEYCGLGIDVDNHIAVYIYQVPSNAGTRTIAYKAQDQREYQAMYDEWYNAED